MARAVRLLLPAAALGAAFLLALQLAFPFFVDTVLDALLAWAVLTVVTWPITAAIGRVRGRLAERPPRPLAFALVSLAVANVVGFVALEGRRGFRAPVRVFVMGVDAASWRVMDPLIAAGRLPTTAALRVRGASGPLRSEQPILSPIIWTTIATGMAPNKHGVHDFYATADTVRVPRLWDILEAEGLRVGVFRWLITWPPPAEMNGFLIPDILARDERTYPPQYGALNALRIAQKTKKSLTAGEYVQLTWELVGMGLRLSTIRRLGWELGLLRVRGADERATYPVKRKAELWINRDAFVRLLHEHRPEFVTFYDNGVDTISHYYWKYYEPQHFPDVIDEEVRRYGDTIPSYYEHVDEVLGELLAHVEDDTLVVVVSDHGQQANLKDGEKIFNIRLSSLLRILRLDDSMYGLVIGDRSYVRPKDAANGAALAVAEERIRGVTVAGETLFDVSHDETGLVVAARVPLVDFDRAVRVGEEEVKMAELIYEEVPYSGTHHIDGIIVLAGRHVEPGARIGGATIRDVTPTVLYLADVPLSADMDGRVLRDAVIDAHLASSSIRRVERVHERAAIGGVPATFDADVEERLKALGYVQ